MISTVAQAITGLTDDWPGTLIWSNLYKVAPFQGGNPSPTLKNAQLETCQRHLAAEVALWKPKRILFLTGWSWAEPFFVATLGKHVGERRDGNVQWSGRIEVPFTESVSVVVAVHPQGKKEVAVTQEIKQHFLK